MANGTMATPNLLNDPGFLYWAPLGTTLPTGTVVGSVFTDTWPVAWLAMGMTDAGSTFDAQLAVAEQDAAESLPPLGYRTTGRTATVTFALKSFTATNLQRALNGATLTVTGTTTTTMTTIDPPILGAETRCMIGWESVDSTVRFIGFQCINSGDISLAFQKAPATPTIPFTLNLEKPSATQEFRFITAGTARG